jgi:hypothetical protein
MSLETVTGTLLQAYQQLDPNTIQHAAEIMMDRRTDESLRNRYGWTADFPIYTKEEGGVLYLAPRKHNLIFRNIEDAAAQLRETGNYKPKPEEAAAVIASATSGETLKVKLSDVRLIRDNNHWSHFNIDTADYDKLNEAERALAERIYGQEEDFKKNMCMLDEAGITTTRAFVLHLDYVVNHAEDGAISRLGWLGSFGSDSEFIAEGRSPDYEHGSLRGVRRGVGVAKISEASLEESIIQYIQPFLRDQQNQAFKQGLKKLLKKFEQ